MAAITIRNLSDETHRALKARAASRGRSTEAEVRQILDDAVALRVDIGFGERMVQIAAEVGGFDLEVERDRTVTEPIEFG
ncbi:FitA-like ribbon-helix-helix domain-containing protein [Nocardioides sp. CPCC 206347]|uniref:FitA-like ribbon-helix-helix domain-containing protein n=1 Tax=unclassified Nocardioides TaxID=2615069 RepID=UPI003609D4AF